MSIKDLFNSKSNKATSIETISSLNKDLLGDEYSKEIAIDKDRVITIVDFTNPENFAKYGSAYEYYTNTIERIANTYPYDGSLAERQKWLNESSDLDLYFFNYVYPRYKGFISLGSSSFNNYSFVPATGSSAETYKSSPAPQYVYFVGGVKTDESATSIANLRNSNVYDANKNRQVNLELDTEKGNTIEFFFKLNENADTNVRKALFDAWNGQAIGSTYYNRIIIEQSASSFSTKYIGGTNGLTNNTITIQDPSWDITDWNHYAFVFSNSTGSLECKFFLNGVYTTSVSSSSHITSDQVNNYALTGVLGAYCTTPYAGAPVSLGSASVYGSFDEFRFWKTQRTGKQIYQYINFDIGGGANSDDQSSDLGVYYKFNEGIQSTISSISPYDTVCLDYSGRITNGSLINYSYDVRVSGSAIESRFSNAIEKGDPIIYKSHSDYIQTLEQYQSTGSVYDFSNTNSFINLIPSWILDEEEKSSGELKKLTQVLSSYFDTLSLQIEYINKFRNTDYIEEREKPMPEFIKVLNSAGFDLQDIFSDASIFEELLSRNDEINFEEKINVVKNTIYKNIYNNLAYIQKTKGTEKSFRNLLRCFGIDESLVSFNTYANDFSYDFSDKPSYNNVLKKIISFNDTDNFSATIYQTKSVDSNDYSSYLTGSTNTLIPFTLESEIIFPNKLDNESNNYFTTDFVSSSLFGVHRAGTSDTDFTIPANDYGNFQVYCVKSDINDKSAYFLLKSTGYGATTIVLTSSTYPEIYTNQKWNFGVRFKNNKFDTADIGYPTGSETYVLEFFGVNTSLDQIQNQFSLSASVSRTDAINALSSNRRIYAGSHRNNFTGSLLEQTDIKLSHIRYWYSYLNDDTIIKHSFDPLSYGVDNPGFNAYFSDVTSSFYEIPSINTLALYWNFDKLTSVDSNGEFFVYDLSSGSLTSSYGRTLGSQINKKRGGKGAFFLENDTNVVEPEYIFTAKKTLPENIYSLDTIQVLSDEIVRSSKALRPFNLYFSFEKSMYKQISEEMLKLFSSISVLNNLIGNPINKFRNEYRDLNYLKNIFFEKVTNEPDLEKFIDLYKWIDSGILESMTQLVPATSKFAKISNNTIESHLLERNKVSVNNNIYNKTFKRDYTKIIDISVSNDIRTSTADESSPRSPGGSNWLKKKSSRLSYPTNTPSNPNVDANRESIRKAIFFDSTKKIAKTYDVKNNNIINKEEQKISAKQSLGRVSSVYETKFDGNSNYDSIRNLYTVADAFNIFLESLPSVSGNLNSALEKQKVFSSASFSFSNEYEQNNNFPFTQYKNINTQQAYFSNLHYDSYGNNLEIGLQGPYPEQHVGGNKHRHNELFISESNRTELYNFTNNTISNIGVSKPRPFYREERVKRPVSIKNIKTTGSVAGNYLNNYEIIVTNGRFINNKSFVHTSSLNIINDIPIVGAVSSSLPNRKIYKSVIVNKFSSPGEYKTSTKAFLDPASEELSLYNSINLRNNQARKDYNALLTNTSSFSETSASIHKVNKNPNYSYELSGASVTAIVAADYDNWFINHQIPRSDKQYSWISSSLDSSSVISGYFSKYPNLDISSDMLFVSSSSGSLGDIDFAGTNSTILKTFSNNTISTNVILSGTNLNNYLLNVNGPYGYPSWKQIRGVYNPIILRERKNNKITVQNPVTALNGNIFDKTSDSFSEFKLNPFSINYPYTQILKSNPDLPFTTNYTNEIKQLPQNLQLFVNKQPYSIRNRENSNYKLIKNLYKNEFNTNVDILQSLTTTELLFPKDQYLGLNFIRERIFYDNSRSTGSLESLRTFWRKNAIDRARHYGNDLNPYYYQNSSSAPVDMYNISYILGKNNNLVQTRLFTSTFSDYRRLSGSYTVNIWGNTFLTHSFGDKSIFSDSIFSMDSITGSNFSASFISNGNYNLTYSFDSSNPVGFIRGGLSNFLLPEHRYFITYDNVYMFATQSDVMLNKIPNIRTGVYSSYTGSEYLLLPPESITPRPQLIFTNNMPSYSSSVSMTYKRSENGTEVNDESIINEFYILNNGYIYNLDSTPNTVTNYDQNSQFNYTQILENEPFYDSYGEFIENIKPLSKDYTLVPEYNTSKNMKKYLSEGLLTKVEDLFEIEGSPLYTSSIIAKNFTSITQYQNDLSEILRAADKFNIDLSKAKDNKNNAIELVKLNEPLNKLLLTGSKANISNPIENETAEIISNYEPTKNQNLKFNLSVSGIKKLLPYKGFYPSERILQLSSLFAKSFLNIKDQYDFQGSTLPGMPQAASATGYLSNGTPIPSQILTLIQPLFAPGILLNTIKSSLAVDWPVFITSSVDYTGSTKSGIESNQMTYDSKTKKYPIFYSTGSNQNGSYPLQTSSYINPMFIDKNFNFRLPFEALINFDTVIPDSLKTTTNNLYYLNPTYYASNVVSSSEIDKFVFPSYNMQTLNSFRFKTSEYKAAMSNFLAEIPSFFLEGSQDGQKLSYFQSSKNDQSFEFTANKTYYMDVVMEKPKDFTSFYDFPINKDFKNSNNRSYLLRMLSEDSLYGPPTRYWDSINAAENGWNLMFSMIDTPSYAPYNPPYQYGKAIARLSYKPTTSGTKTLNEIFADLKIEYLNPEANEEFRRFSSFLNNSIEDNYSNSPAYKNMMTLSSSINFKLKTVDLIAQDNGALQDVSNGPKKWVIQTKFETPAINFKKIDGINFEGQPGEISKDGNLSFMGGQSGDKNGVYSATYRGLWTTSGSIPLDTEYIKFYLQESYDNTVNQLETGSLAQACGFLTNDKKDIGKISSTKSIKEGIAIIPYTSYRNDGTIDNFYSNNPVDPKYFQKYVPTINFGQNYPQLKDMHFLTFNRQTLESVLNITPGPTNLKFLKNKLRSVRPEFNNNSIKKTFEKLLDYNMPPFFDWFQFAANDRLPIFYIAEFSQNLDRTDLMQIWQNCYPTSLKNLNSLSQTIQNIDISHNFGNLEFYENKKLQPDLKFLMFKVKKKANSNYFSLTKDSSDDSLFNVLYGNSSTNSTEISYNWPYDFCSLVEYANVKASFEFVSSSGGV